MENIKGENASQGRALLALLYLTGCRPVEALSLRNVDFQKDELANFLIINFKGGFKRSVARTLRLPMGNFPMVKLIWDYVVKTSADRQDSALTFYNWRNKYIRNVVKVRKNEQGELIPVKAYVREEVSNKLRYHVVKWFTGVIPGSLTPYFLRHNRFSDLAQKGATDRQLKQWKGSRTDDSLQYYIHQSKQESMKVGAMLRPPKIRKHKDEFLESEKSEHEAVEQEATQDNRVEG